MALDMSPGGGTQQWFGFSPAVVLGILVLVLGGGGMAFAKQRTDPYVAALQKVCADSDAALDRYWAEKESKPPSEWTSLFQDISAGVNGRLSALRAISDTGTHATEHAALVASEARVADLAAVFQVDLVRDRSTAMPNARAILEALKETDAKYVALGAPKGCSD